MGEERTGSHVAPVALVIVVIAAGAVAALGGLRTSPVRLRAQLAAGQSVDTGQWRVRPLSAWTGDRCPLAGAMTPPAPCLSVEVELTNLTTASSNDVADAIVISDPQLPARARPELMLARDRGVLFQLHPRMTERVVLSWKLPAAAHQRVVSLVIRGKRFKERDNLLGGEGWFDPRPVAGARLPLTAEVTATGAGGAP